MLKIVNLRSRKGGEFEKDTADFINPVINNKRCLIFKCIVISEKAKALIYPYLIILMG